MLTGIKQSLVMEEQNLVSGKQLHDGAEFCCRSIRGDPFENKGLLHPPRFC